MASMGSLARRRTENVHGELLPLLQIAERRANGGMMKRPAHASRHRSRMHDGTQLSSVARWLAAVLMVGVGVVAPQRRAGAAGFALREESAKLMGMAYAGTAAVAEDATTGFYNVAGLTRIRQGSVVGTVTGVLLNLDFHATDSTVFGQPVSGTTNVDPTRNVAIP